MCGGSFAFWFCIVLFFTLSSNTPRNFTSDNEEDNNNDNNKNHIVPYENCGNTSCIQLISDDLDMINDLMNKISDEAMNPIINEEMNDINNTNNIRRNKFNTILNELNILRLSCRIVSMLCLLTIFMVYSLLPELHNIHSFMLRKYCSLLFFAYIIDTISTPSYPIKKPDSPYFICVIIALVNYFCSLSSYFWLSAMSFDIWWTFRDFCLLQKNVKQERKKLIYSIFAWGGPFIFTIICIIMDFVPNLPKNLIRPEFCFDKFWFHEIAASELYFYAPVSVCVISSICLSIYTALKIMRYEKDTTRHLRDSGSRFYNDKKRWLNLYLYLFIMRFIIMATNCIMGAALKFWLIGDDIDLLFKLLYVSCSLFLLDTMQDISMFIIFVCKKTIMRQLLKRFCQNCKCFSKTST